MIVILHSAITDQSRLDDQETLLQVAAVQTALESLGYPVTALPFDLNFKQLAKTLARYKPILVFNLVESIGGRSDFCHLVPLWLEELKYPYTGGSARSILMSSDKLLAKNFLDLYNIPYPKYLSAKDLLTQDFPNDGPYLVKSAREDGSLGIDQTSIVHDRDACIAVMADRQQRFGGEWFAERYIEGRELNISLLAGPKGPYVLPIAEIEFKNMSADQFAIVDYAAKWQIASNAYKDTPRSFNTVEENMLEPLRHLAHTCWDIFAVKSYARVDVRIDPQGKPWVLELNANPSLAPDAGFVAAAQMAGLNYVNLIERIVKDAL